MFRVVQIGSNTDSKHFVKRKSDRLGRYVNRSSQTDLKKKKRCAVCGTLSKIEGNSESCVRYWPGAMRHDGSVGGVRDMKGWEG